MLITLYLIVTATFFLLSAIPGNALTSKIAKLPQTVQTKIIEKYGYDKPVAERYVITMKGLLINGDFGESIIRPGETFAKNLKLKLPVTIRLSVQQILLGVTLGILLGIIAAMKRGTFWDKLILVAGQKEKNHGLEAGNTQSFQPLPVPAVLLPIIQDLPKQVCWKASIRNIPLQPDQKDFLNCRL